MEVRHGTARVYHLWNIAIQHTNKKLEWAKGRFSVRVEDDRINENHEGDRQ